MKPEIEIWEQYGPIFSLEERVVFPTDFRELEFYRRLRTRFPGSCMEIGAGDGRLVGSISSDSLTVGLEPSSALCELWYPDDRSRAERVRGLAQQLPFGTSSFDLILFPYNGIHCVLRKEDRKALISEISRVLVPGGILFMEACHRFHHREDEKNAERYDYSKDGVELRLVETVDHDWIRSTISFHMHYTGDSVPSGATDIVLDLALLSCGELLTELVDNGLKILTLWGDYDHRPWDLRYSPRLLVLAERIEE